MRLKKTAALLLAVVLAFGLTACASENVKWIAEVDGAQVPAGVYLSSMLDAVTKAKGLMEDPEADVLKQQIEGVPATDWIMAKTEELFKKYVAIEQKFNEQGLSMDQATMEALSQEAQYQWEYLKEVYEKNGVSYESFLKLLTNTNKEGLLFEAQFGKDGKTPVPEADLRKAFEEGYFRVMYVTASLTNADGTPMEEAGVKTVTDRLNGILEQANAPDAKYQDVILAFEKADAAKVGQDESTVHAHDETSHVYFMDRTNPSYPPEFLAEIEGMKLGETRMLTTPTTAYVLQKLDLNERPEDMEQYRGSLQYQLKKDEFTAIEETWADAVTLNYNEEAKALYTPAKLKLK